MLEHLLNPRAIAVIDASHDERRPGGHPSAPFPPGHSRMQAEPQAAA